MRSRRDTPADLKFGLGEPSLCPQRPRTPLTASSDQSKLLKAARPAPRVGIAGSPTGSAAVTAAGSSRGTATPGATPGSTMRELPPLGSLAAAKSGRSDGQNAVDGPIIIVQAHVQSEARGRLPKPVAGGLDGDLAKLEAATSAPPADDVDDDSSIRGLSDSSSEFGSWSVKAPPQSTFASVAPSRRTSDQKRAPLEAPVAPMPAKAPEKPQAPPRRAMGLSATQRRRQLLIQSLRHGAGLGKGEPSTDAAALAAAAVARAAMRGSAPSPAQNQFGPKRMAVVQPGAGTTSSEEGAAEQPVVERKVPKGRLLEWSVTHRIPSEFMMLAFEIFEEHAVPARIPQKRHQVKGADEPYDVLTEGRLERTGFEKFLCSLHHVNKPEELSEGLLDTCFKAADSDHSQSLDFLEFAEWYVRYGFSEAVLLTEQQRKIRQIAREHELPIVTVEEYKQAFDDFDEDGSGCIEFEEFQKLLYNLIKVPSHLDLPVNRVRQFWTETDVDGGGAIGFEEFLLFYTRYFSNDGMGKHPLEEFYRALRPVPTRVA